MSLRHDRQAKRARWAAEVCSILGVLFLGAQTDCCPELPSADLAVTECRPVALSSAIVGGTLTGDGAFGEVGTLFGVGVAASSTEYSSPGLCSATLIAPDVVVTAAHCVGGFPRHRIRISTHPCPGPDDFETLADLAYVAVHPYWEKSQDATRRPVVKYTQPAVTQRAKRECDMRSDASDAGAYWACIDGLDPHFFANSRHIDAQTGDLAIAILSKPLQTHPLAHLPSPAEASEHLQIGSRLTAVGYGVAGRILNGGLAAGDRYAGRVRIDELGTEEFRLNFASARICNGDSGGPLLQQIGAHRVLLGVGVRVYPNQPMHREMCNGPAIATRVDAYVPWIQDTLRAACDSGSRTSAMCNAFPL